MPSGRSKKAGSSPPRAPRSQGSPSRVLPPPRLPPLTMPQDVIGGQEGFSWDWSPDLRVWLQTHVDPLAGSPAVKLLIVKHLEESSRYQEKAAAPTGAWVAGQAEDGAPT